MQHEIRAEEVQSLIFGFQHDIGSLSNDLSRPITLEDLAEGFVELGRDFGNRFVLVSQDLDTSLSDHQNLANQLLISLDKAGYKIVRKDQNEKS